MKKNNVYFLFSILLFCFSCKKKETVDTAAMQQLPTDFVDFYQKFHSDSLFQQQHINFPLLGLPQDVDSATLVDRDFYFTADTWIMHQPVDFSKGEFKQDISTIGNRLITERIFKSDNSFAIERRFAKLSDNEWHLIHYIAPNRFSK
jgi:hypothetical protein